MTTQELDILEAETLEKIYRTALDNNLADVEYNYFIHSILQSISLGLTKSAYKTMKKNEIVREGDKMIKEVAKETENEAD